MTPFTIDNLPYGVISTDENPGKRCAVAFEDCAIDLDLLYRSAFFTSISELSSNVFANVSTRNALGFWKFSSLIMRRTIGTHLQFCPRKFALPFELESDPVY